MILKLTIQFVLLVAVCVAPVAAAGAQPTNDAGAKSPAKKSRIDLRQFLLDRPPVPITTPRGAKPKKDESYLPQPQSLVVDRRCRIAYRPDTGWYLLTFLPRKRGEAVLPRWVLPSERLEQIEPILAEKPDVILRVSGETAVYRGRAFILLTRAMIEPGRKRRLKTKHEPAKAQATPLESVADSESEKSSAETSPPPEPAKQASPSAESIVADLLRDRPGKPILLPTKTEKPIAAPSVAPITREQLDEDRGGMRIDRAVVIVPDASGQWMEARFGSDNTLQDQPVRLLPCKLLAKAERYNIEGKRKAVRFVISGRLTQYKGHRYLLLRKLLLERELGRF